MVSCNSAATPDRSILSSSSIACTRLINRLVDRIVVEGWPVAVADPEELRRLALRDDAHRDSLDDGDDLSGLGLRRDTQG